MNVQNNWSSDVLLSDNGNIYLKRIEKWFSQFPLTNKQKNGLESRLTSLDNSDHLGAINELCWWIFWVSRGFDLIPIPTTKNPTPDFILRYCDLRVIFEVTTLNLAKDRFCSEITHCQNSSIRRIIKKIYTDKIEQLQYGYSLNILAVLVLFNYDQWSGLDTQFYRLLNKPKFIKIMPNEMSALIYVEKYIIDEKPCFKRDSLAIIPNPNSILPFPDKIFEILERISKKARHR